MSLKISVLMTVYNAEKYVHDSIKSILDQIFKDFEFIIVDDCSTDNSKKIIEKFEDKRIRFFFSDKKLGRTKALNFGLKKCSSNLIAIQDADDISHTERLLKCLEQFNSDNSIGLGGSNFSFINENNEEKIDLKNIFDKNLKSLKFSNNISHSSIIFDRNKFQKKIFYDETFLYAQDYHLILKYLKFSKISLIDQKLVKIRVHEENMSNNKLYKKIKIKENIRLLDFSISNFNLNFYERNKILIYKLKNYLKLILNIF